MSLTRLLSAASRKPVQGRALHWRRGRKGVRRDPSGKHSSDRVWSLVEQMMNGDADAATVLSDVIEEGVSGGKTIFVPITLRATKRFGRVTPASVKPGAFAAITPGRSIVLFGVHKVYPKGSPTPQMRGYMRRFAIGDMAEYDSYNLVYYGPILTITPKTVTISKDRGGRRDEKASLSIERFNQKNYDFDLSLARRRNNEWSD